MSASFDRLYRQSEDPWGTRTRWYERRKRALLMASLPREHYPSIYEPGCGTGHVSVELAARCDTLLASDGSDEALAVAAAALAGRDNVTLCRQQLPTEWPSGSFDLVVFGELLYFLSAPDLLAVAAAARDSAGSHGTIVACDWRAPIEGYGHSGDATHRRFADSLALPRLFEYVDDDFILTGWSRDPTSVARRDGVA